MPLSPIQLAQQTHVLTANDIILGYVVIPIVWPEPFTDTDYSVVLGIHDLDDPPNLSFTTGDVHDLEPEGCNALAYISAAVPLIQGQADLVASTATTSPLSLSAVATSLYQITLYYGPSGSSGANSDSWAPTISWTDPSGNALQFTPFGGGGPAAFLGVIYGGAEPVGGPSDIQSYSIPFFAKAGTPITVTGAYTNNPFPINFSARIVRMPNHSTIAQPGDVFMLHALAIHN